MSSHEHDHNGHHHYHHNDFHDYNEAIREYKKTFPSKEDVLEHTPDPAVKELIHNMEKVGLKTVFDRFDAQKPHRTGRNLLQKL